jgi:hypothetical protein
MTTILDERTRDPLSESRMHIRPKNRLLGTVQDAQWLSEERSASLPSFLADVGARFGIYLIIVP